MSIPRSVPVLLLAAAVLVAATNGCGSFRASSDSASNIVSSPFKWSSHSSSPDDDSSSDVSDAAEAWALESTDVAALRRDVGRIAASYGVTDWQNDPGTYAAIGHGLRRAGIEVARYETIKADLAQDQPLAMAWIQRGYDTAELL